MKKFRIIEVQEPLNWFYIKGEQQEPPKDVSFSSPKMENSKGNRFNS